ncbi:hypothetical protein ERO13_D08G061001v2 [Gossypium hirsutum]|nr:hypothetical protein ERO13_D08G061001v2 [Gossypium hirsutum]
MPLYGIVGPGPNIINIYFLFVFKIHFPIPLTHFPISHFPSSTFLSKLMPSSLFFSIRVHLRQQSTSTDPPLVLHGSTHFQNQRLERSYKRLLQTSTCTFAC